MRFMKQRDFTLWKAGLLAGLIGLGACLSTDGLADRADAGGARTATAADRTV